MVAMSGQQSLLQDEFIEPVPKPTPDIPAIEDPAQSGSGVSAAIGGNDTDEVLNGTASNDTISGGGGRDAITGGAGDDTIYGFGSTDSAAGSGNINWTRVGTGFASPVFASSAPGDPNTLYVVEQNEARVMRLNPATGVTNPTPFLDIPNGEISASGERGLLGLAFHPNYAANGFFYVFLTNPAGDIEVRRYTRGASGTADLATMTPIITVPHPNFGNHNGGWIGFGPDGNLYIATGDGGSGGDPSNNAQNKNSLLGKILRIDVNSDDFAGDATRNYHIPAGNPFVGVAGADEVWAYGLRNPWRNGFDTLTGDFYIGDVGQGQREEVNYIAAGTGAGFNFGWKVMEGNLVFDSGVVGNPPPGDPSLKAPVAEYGHSNSAFGGFALIGGYVYRGPAPGAQGLYFFADEVSNQFWTLHMVGGVAQDFDNRLSQFVLDTGTFGSPSSFGLDGSNNLYAVSLGGAIYRIDPTIAAGDSADTIDGGAGNDQIYSGVGADIVTGGDGNDLFAGGNGDDTLTGGGGLDRAIYFGARSAYSVSQGATTTVSGNSEGTDTLNGVERLIFADQTVVVRATQVLDFNGEGSGDLLFQNTNGQASVWLLNGLSVQSASDVGSNPGTAWQAKGSGDFNGDGKADILWQNTNGQAAIWLMNGQSVAAGDSVGANPGTSWQVKASGDFDGDTKADILWQNTSGQAAVWFQNGLSITAADAAGGNPGATWHIISSGDFNADGRSDVLWQNDNGQVAIWLMNGLSLLAGDAVGGNPGSAWHVKGSGDFNGDGKSDILFQHDNGQVAIWMLNGLAVTAADAVSNAGAGWSVLGAADLNNDGKSDILFQNANGQIAAWLMNGLAITSGNAIGSNPGSAWHLAGAPG